MKKSVCLLLAIIISCSVFVYAYAEESLPERYEEYLQYIEGGILNEDVTYETWISAVHESEYLELLLENEIADFTCVYTEYGEGINSNPPPTPDGDFSMRKGDILITNGTSSAGILGHAGIAVSATTVLHIAGGENSHPIIISLDDWKQSYNNKSYRWTKFYRHSNSTYANRAANWGKTKYGPNGPYANADYEKLSELDTFDKTYCSKIVWQCYYYGISENHQATGGFGACLPYQLPNRIKNISLKKQIYGHPY